MKRQGKRLWKSAVCFLLALLLSFGSALTVFAEGNGLQPGENGYWDNETVRYYYYRKPNNDTGKYYREGIKEIRLDGISYYDTMYRPNQGRDSSWADVAAKQAADKAAARAVTVKIAGLPDRTAVTLDDEKDVLAVKRSYESLTVARRDYVPEESKSKLSGLVAELEYKKSSLQGTTGIAAVISLLRPLATLSISDQSTTDEIVAAAKTTRLARLSWEAMTEEQQGTLAATTEEDVKAGLTKIGHDGNPAAVSLETTAVEILAAQLPAGYPDCETGTTEEEKAREALAKVILDLYDRMNEGQQVQAGSSIANLLASRPKPSQNTTNVISHEDDRHNEVNIPFLDKMIKKNLLGDWAHLADKIFSTQGEVANYCENKYYKNHYTGENPDRGMNVASALASGSGDQSGNWGDKNGWRYTGLKTANSLSDVRNAMADEVRSGAARKAVTRKEILSKDELTIGKDRLESLKSEDKTKAFYSIATYVARDPSSVKITYQSYGLCFYDFDLTILADEDMDYVTAAEEYNDPEAGENNNPVLRAAGDTTTGVEYRSTGGKENASIGYAENNTDGDSSVTLTLTDKESTTVTTSFTTTESYSYSEMIGVEESMGKSNDSWWHTTIKTAFTAGQTFSTARGETNSAVKEFDHTISTTRTLPPYSAAQISNTEDTVAAKIPFDTPTAIRFKVAIFSIGGEGTCTATSTNFTQDVAGYVTSDFCTVFGAGSSEGGTNAQDNLRKRAVTNKDIGGFDRAYGNTSGVLKNVGGRNPELHEITWKGNFSATETTAIDTMTRNVPMAASGTIMTVDRKQLASSIDGIVPIYHLKEVRLKEGIPDEYTMNPGNSLSLDSLTLEGLNKYRSPYYGFNARDGHWVLCDENGTVRTASDWVAINTERTGKQTLTVTGLPGTGDGVQYIKWVLNDDTVSNKLYTALKETGHATNEGDGKSTDITSPYVRIKVTEKPFEGTIRLTGEYTGYVGEPPVSLSASGLQVYMEDEDTKEVVRPVTWEAKEKNGISLTEDGQVTFTKAGQYHVHVMTGVNSKPSDWVTITALAKKELAAITISDDTNPKVLTSFVLNDGDNKVRLGGLTFSGTDQYGNSWPLTADDIIWKVDGAEVAGSTYTVQTAGDYKITAYNSDYHVTSNELELTVKEARRLASLEISCPELTDKGLGVGEGYRISLALPGGQVAVTAKDQYKELFDFGQAARTWTSDDRYSSVIGNGLLTGNAAGNGWLQLTVGTGDQAVSSNKLEYKVLSRPYVKWLYGSNNSICEEDTFLLADTQMTAQDQNKKNYELSQEELDRIQWSLDPSRGTIKEAASPDGKGVVFNGTAGTIKVNEGTLDYGETGTVGLKGTFDNQNGKPPVEATALITVEQQPILETLTLARKGEEGDIETDDTFRCKDFFTLTATDQYKREFDLTGQQLTVTSDDSQAFLAENADNYDRCTLKAGQPKKTAQITVSGVNRQDKTISSNPVTLKVARVRTMESIAFKNLPEFIPLGKKIDMAQFGATCYDDEGEPYTDQELEAYPARIDYSLDKKDTDTRLDTAKNILTTGNVLGPIEIAASAATVSSSQTDDQGVTSGSRLWVGPKPEAFVQDTPVFCGDGGTDKVTLSGSWLVDGAPEGIEFRVEGVDTDYLDSVMASGTNTSVSALVNLPPNAGQTDLRYNIYYLIGGNAINKDAPLQVTVKAHSLVKTEAREADCTKAGNIEYWKCSNCGNYYADEAMKKSLSEKETIIPAIGHRWDQGQTSKAPTCTEAGVRTFTCLHDKSHTRTETIAATGHKWDKGKVSKAPTCTKAGVRTFTCLHDKNHTRTETIAATGHRWNRGKVKASRGIDTGLISYTCKRDPSHKKTAKIPLLLARISGSGSNGVAMTWNKEPLADGYDVFFAECNGRDVKRTCRFVKTVKKTGKLQWKKKRLKKGFAYKGYVKAYRLNGKKKQYIAQSLLVHCLVGHSNDRYTDARTVEAVEKSLTIRQGKSKRIKGSTISKRVASKDLLDHEELLRFASSDSRIARVTAKGQVKGLAKGSCKIFIISVNGARTSIKVTVK